MQEFAVVIELPQAVAQRLSSSAASMRISFQEICFFLSASARVALDHGLVSETLGSEFTITVTGAEVELAPRLSVAVAVRSSKPAAVLLSVTA